MTDAFHALLNQGGDAHDKEARNRIGGLERELYSGSHQVAEIGDLTAGLPVVAAFTHVWQTVAYPAGGEPATTLPNVPNLQGVLFTSPAGYVHEYDAGSGNVKAFVAGAEPIGTDMTVAVGSVLGVAVGRHDYTVPCFKFDRSKALLRIELEVSSALAIDRTNFWSIQPQLLRGADQDRTEEIGEPFSTADGVTPGSRYTLFDAQVPTGAEIVNGLDRLQLFLTPNGTPPALTKLQVHVYTRRRP